MKVICFSSHSATWFFAFAEAVIASTLQKKGHEVLYITPGNMFPEISDTKQETILREEFKLNGYTIEKELSKKDLKEIKAIIKKLNKNNFNKLIIDDIHIGKIALYEILLDIKKMDVNFTPNEWKRCLIEIKNTLISFYACRNILKREKPDRIIVYNALYSVNHVWKRFAKVMKIPIYFIHHGVNFSDINNILMISRNDTFYYIDKLKKIWNKLETVPVNEKRLNYVTDHVLELIKAKHYLIYSAPKSRKLLEIRKIFNIKEDQKILTATMSSYDEMFAAKYIGAWNLPNKLVFPTQVDWIKKLIEYVKTRPNLFLIIRVHPREFPNKRDGVMSEHAKMLVKVLKNLPNNIKVNWPTDNISIYDLAQETDVFLNAWSTVGVEMSLLGIPVVLYSEDLVQYPSDLNYVGKDIKKYFSKIEEALKDGWSYEKIKKTYRWLVLYYCRTVMRFRNPETETKQLTFRKVLMGMIDYIYTLIPPQPRKSLIKFFLKIPGLGVSERQRNECRKQLTEPVEILGLEKMLLNLDDTLVDIKLALKEKVTIQEEDIFIRRQIKRIYNSLFFPSKVKTFNKHSLQWKLRKALD